MGPGGLHEILCNLAPKLDAKRLVGFDLSDDAGVYLLDGTALIQTIDVITPIVDDPYLFGKIAAANAISDIYAMGGKPITALNFLAFPEKQLPMSVAADILRGGMDICEEAGCALMGGHTVRDDEIKYGLAVTGVAKPDAVVTNAGAKPGDVIILTKPIGTGIISTALKRGAAPAKSVDAAAKNMAALNKSACEAMMSVGANACTDVTGFGLVGHLAQLASASNVAIFIEHDSVPMLPGALTLAKKGFVPGGTKNNFNVFKKRVVFYQLEQALIDVLFDAQTSGGLLISVPESKSKKLISELKKLKTPAAVEIGKVDERLKRLKHKDVFLVGCQEQK